MLTQLVDDRVIEGDVVTAMCLGGTEHRARWTVDIAAGEPDRPACQIHIAPPQAKHLASTRPGARCDPYVNSECRVARLNEAQQVLDLPGRGRLHVRRRH